MDRTLQLLSIHITTHLRFWAEEKQNKQAEKNEPPFIDSKVCQRTTLFPSKSLQVHPVLAFLQAGTESSENSLAVKLLSAFSLS